MHQMSLTGQWEFVTAHEESVTAHGKFVTVLRNLLFDQFSEKINLRGLFGN